MKRREFIMLASTAVPVMAMIDWPAEAADGEGESPAGPTISLKQKRCHGVWTPAKGRRCLAG